MSNDSTRSVGVQVAGRSVGIAVDAPDPGTALEGAVDGERRPDAVVDQLAVREADVGLEAGDRRRRRGGRAAAARRRAARARRATTGSPANVRSAVGVTVGVSSAPRTASASRAATKK